MSDVPRRGRPPRPLQPESAPRSLEQKTADAVKANGDQPVSHEVDLGEGYAMILGRRNVYIRYLEKVAVIPCVWHNLE